MLRDRGAYRYSDEYYTPEYIYKNLGVFDIDPCAGPISSIATLNNRDKNGLEIDWVGRVWLNPPYSDMNPWIEKFRNSASGIALLNSKTDTKWFKTICSYCYGIMFITSRIKFFNSTKAGNICGSALFLRSEQDFSIASKSGLNGVLVRL